MSNRRVLVSLLSGISGLAASSLLLGGRPAPAVSNPRQAIVPLKCTVIDERGTLDRTIDMLRKLRAEGAGYDATGLVLAEWKDHPGFASVALRSDAVPQDLSVGSFLEVLVDRVLERTPIDMHVKVRELREKRDLPIADVEAD